jgi:hypothetical protein
MTKLGRILVGAGVVAIAGCATQQQQLQRTQDQATSVAVRRGQFELNCPTASGVILNSTMLEPVAWRGIERAEYTVGVSGCGKQATYIVVCPEDTNGCVAGAGQNNAKAQ